MRVRWWQGGLHIEPESDVETEAMLVLLNGLKYEKPPDLEAPRTVGEDASGDVKRGLDLGL